jgi:hypothetical protein
MTIVESKEYLIRSSSSGLQTQNVHHDLDQSLTQFESIFLE